MFENTAVVDGDLDSYRIQNIVLLVEFDLTVNLNQAAVRLGMENVEYEPEQFPRLIYRPSNFELVMLLFGTGKVIITGTISEKEAEDAINNLYNMLSILNNT